MVVETPVRMLFGESAAATEQADYDLWEVDGNAILLQDVVEESVVMALPLAPLHDAETGCGSQAEQEPAGGPVKTRPFADLRSRMAAKDN